MAKRARGWVLWGLGAFLCALQVRCTWQPTAREVQPERLADGAYVVQGMLDISRYAGLIRNPDSESITEILDLRTRKRCALPPGTRAISGVLTSTRKPGSDDAYPAFLWPAVRVAENKARTLTFADQSCRVTDARVDIATPLYTLVLDEDQRGVLMFLDGEGTLSLYDPWIQRLTKISRNLTLPDDGQSTIALAVRPQGAGGKPVGPQLLWLLEDNTLALRTLEGELVLRRGTRVTGWAQAALAPARVAIVDQGDLYDAVAPDFEPTLVERDACEPSYSGETLSFFFPCAARQLVRINLKTRKREEFLPSVFAQREDSGFIFEWAANVDATQGSRLFVTPPGAQRVEVRPALESPRVLDRKRIIGFDAASSLGIWSEQDGFTTLLKRCSRLYPFIDARANRLSWMAIHEDNDGRGTLSYLEQPSFRRRDLARNVPVGSLMVQSLFPVEEPVIFYVRDATTATKPARYRGRLEARVLSGELESTISGDVTSYAVVPDPAVLGLLYATGGKEQGLWFAAL